MNALWLNMTARYDALQRRERWLIALALLGGIVLIGFSLFIDPALRRGQLAERTLAGQQAQLLAMQTQMATLQAPERHPDVAAQAELGQLKQRLDELSARMRVLESSLVPPERMPGLLEDMIGKRSGLRLLSLKTLPVAPFVEKAQAGAGEAAATGAAEAPEKAGLFKHGVEIRLEGSYQELTAYLERLEKSRMKLLWNSVALSAEGHPRLVLTLTVYSLSLDRTWLVV